MNWTDTSLDFSALTGLTLTRAEQIGDDVIEFEDTDGNVYQLYHDQDCCESVWVEDINGDLNDMVGTPILMSEEISNNFSAPATSIVQHSFIQDGPRSEHDESYTWTYYKMSSIKGYVDIRWYGTSNGYYSESVSFVRKNKD